MHRSFGAAALLGAAVASMAGVHGMSAATPQLSARSLKRKAALSEGYTDSSSANRGGGGSVAKDKRAAKKARNRKRHKAACKG